MIAWHQQQQNKNAKALKLHSVILLFPRLYAIIAFSQRLTVILTVVFDQMHLICTYSWSAGPDQSESSFCFRIHVTSGFNGFSNRHFDRKLMT